MNNELLPEYQKYLRDKSLAQKKVYPVLCLLVKKILADNIMLSIHHSEVLIDDCQIKSIKKAEPLLTLLLPDLRLYQINLSLDKFFNIVSTNGRISSKLLPPSIMVVSDKADQMAFSFSTSYRTVLRLTTSSVKERP